MLSPMFVSYEELYFKGDVRAFHLPENNKNNRNVVIFLAIPYNRLKV